MSTRKDSFNKLHYNTLPKKLCDLGNYKRKEKKRENKNYLKDRKLLLHFFIRVPMLGSCIGI